MRFQTLADALADVAVDTDTLRQRHGPILKTGAKVLGVVPNCHPYLELWPVGLRTYNLMVPNLLNIPAALLKRNTLKPTVGLVMYASSRAAGCSYCAAHSCSFALRRGATVQQLVQSSTTAASQTDALGAADRAAIRVAEALGTVPSTLTDGQREAFRAAFAPSEVEWIVLAIAMTGWLNKFMDGLGVPLEPSMYAVAERVISEVGWRPGQHMPDAEVKPEDRRIPPTDSVATWLGLIPHLRAVIRKERHDTAGIPKGQLAMQAHLLDRTGSDWHVLGMLHHRRAVRALAAILRDNTDPTVSVLGLRAKFLAGAKYAETVQDDELSRISTALMTKADAAAKPTFPGKSGLDDRAIAAIGLAKSASSSPAGITPDDVASAVECLSPPAIVELMVWLSVLQLLQRLHAYFGE